ncbi:dihydrodipicolinate synthase family protein [Actinopolymorpha pittospori]
MSERELVITAVPTPFVDDGAIDLRALESLLAELSPQVDGVLMAGTTGEFPALSDDERVRLFEVAVSTLGPARVIGHIGHASGYQVRRLAEASLAVGVRRFALLTPYYLPTDATGVLRWYADVSKDLGEYAIYPYFFPERTGLVVEPDLARDVMALPGMAGLKVSGAAAARIAEYAGVLGANQRLWSGSDGELPSVLGAGGHGVISGVSAAFPDLFGRLRAAVATSQGLPEVQDDVERAVRLVGPSISRLLLALRLRTGSAWAGRMSGPAVDEETAEAIRAVVARLT